jgi:hypothetical protein
LRVNGLEVEAWAKINSGFKVKGFKFMDCGIWLRAERLGIMDTKDSNTELCSKVQGSTFGDTG